jgi:mannan endo-1,4-beta-mannosidase
VGQPRRFSGLLIAAVFAVTMTPGASAAPDVNASFVKVSGTQFTLAGKPFRFVGVNMYFVAGSYEPGKFGCGPFYTNEELDDNFRAVHDLAGAGVVRFWAFQSYTKGATDWSQIDRVLNAARKYRLKVIPVLENEWRDCTKADYYKDSSWFSSGYKSAFGSNYKLSYEDYVRAIVGHYKDDPTIMAWMLMNSAEGENGPLVAFTRSVSGEVKSIDRNHLVTLGTLADEGQKGTDLADEYAGLYGVSSIDFADAHDFKYPAQPLPRSAFDRGAPLPDPATCRKSIACAMSVTLNRLHKPFLIGEAGIEAVDDASRRQRAAQIEAKIKAQWENGGAGYLVWLWSSDPKDRFAITRSDPLVGVLKRYASPLNQ